MTLDTVPETKASEWVSGSVRSTDSRSSKGSGSTKLIARAEQRGGKARRGKKVYFGAPSRANRPRGIPPPIRRTKSNTAASSPVSEIDEVDEPPRPLPSAPKPQPEKKEQPEKKKEQKHRDTSSGGWIVDPDFRTKYIDKKEKQKEMLARAIRAPATTALTNNVVFGTASSRPENGKGKNVQVADEALPSLPRQKSFLTLLLESEKKATKVGSTSRNGGGESSKAGQLKGDQGKGQVKRVMR
jgi:hypothetical protein